MSYQYRHLVASATRGNPLQQTAGRHPEKTLAFAGNLLHIHTILCKRVFMAKKRTAPKPIEEENSIQRIERPLTLVDQVEQLLRDAIQTGKFTGDKLPTEVELAEQLGVSRETVRRATEKLADEGLLVKFRRKGTFLKRPDPMRLEPSQSTMLGYLQADYSKVGGGEDTVTRSLSGMMLQGALEAANAAGYQLVIRRASPTQLSAVFREFYQQSRPRGLVFASLGEEKLLRQILGLGIPTVLLDHDLHLPQISSVREDSASAVEMLVDHLADLGHRHIALAFWNQVDLNPWRLQGYRNALRKHGLPRRRKWELPVPLTEAGAKDVVSQLLELYPRPTALICFNNTQARQVIEHLKARDVAVPEDISVAGCGGETVAGLTCHQADWYELGRTAVKVLLAAIEEGDDFSPEHILLPQSLIIGQTTALPAEEPKGRKKKS